MLGKISWKVDKKAIATSHKTTGKLKVKKKGIVYATTKCGSSKHTMKIKVPKKYSQEFIWVQTQALYHIKKSLKSYLERFLYDKSKCTNIK